MSSRLVLLFDFVLTHLLGADQFLDVNHSNADDLKQTFFNWSYFMINLGALCSFTGRLHILTLSIFSGAGIAYIQQEIYFGIGLAVPAGVLCVSLLLFSAGFRHYVKLRPAGSIIGPSLRMIYYAWRAPWDDRNNARTFLDRAKYSRDYTGALRFSSESVDHLKGFMRLVPILSVFIYFWSVLFCYQIYCLRAGACTGRWQECFYSRGLA